MIQVAARLNMAPSVLVMSTYRVVMADWCEIFDIAGPPRSARDPLPSMGGIMPPPQIDRLTFATSRNNAEQRRNLGTWRAGGAFWLFCCRRCSAGLRLWRRLGP